MVEPEAYPAFTKTLSKADDALGNAKGTGDRQWHLEQLVGAGWRLVDCIDSGHAIVKLDVDTLAATIRKANAEHHGSPILSVVDCRLLAEAILAEIGGA